MGKTKEYLENADMRYTASMPKEIYKSIKDKENVRLFSSYDAGMYNHYKLNLQWQEAEYFYNVARERKKEIEAKIDFETLETK